MCKMTDSQELLRLYLLQRDKMSEFEKDIIIRTLYVHLLSEERKTEKG